MSSVKKRIRLLPPEKRQKVSTACDSCKKRKYRCTGQNPCETCVRRGYECSYTIVDKRSLKAERIAKLKLQKQGQSINNQEIIHNQQQQQQQFQQFPHQPSNEQLLMFNQGQNLENVNKYDDNLSPNTIINQHQQHHHMLSPDDAPSSTSSISSASTISPTNNIDSPSNTYIPKSLQPLLSFPLNHAEDDDDSAPTSNDGGVSNQNGKCIILLNDKSGTFRFMGETAPLSLLYESRNVVIQYIGAGSNFTEKLQCCPVIDRPDLPPTRMMGNQLPKYEDARSYIEYFKRNINDSFFVFNMEDFNRDYFQMIYNHDELIPEAEKKQKLIIFYLVAAIGSTYSHFTQYIIDSPRSQALFEYALYLLQDTIQDSELWVVITNYLIFHYYQAVLKKSTAWIHLNLAIKFAQSIGMHRTFVNEQFNYKSEDSEYKKKLFRSLYVSDRMSSIFIGRPLTVNDYDYDDPILTTNYNKLQSNKLLDFNSKCQIELTRICHLVGKIVINFYQGRIIDINKTKKLAIELKLWSMNLDDQLSINNIFKASESISNNANHQNTHILLLIHLMQLWATMLLSRPFFMFEAVEKLNPNRQTSTVKNRKLSIQFYQAAVKASILAIKLVNYYMNTSYKQVVRRECYALITCCFYGSLVLGIGVLHGGFKDDEHSDIEMIDTLKMASNMLHEFTPTNKGAERYEDIVNDLIEVLLVNKQRQNSDITIVNQEIIGKQVDKELENLDFRVLNDYNFIEDSNNNLESLIKFQKFFVSPELLPMDLISPSSSDDSSDFNFLNNDGSSTTMPHDYGNYELLYGDKY
ncbi:zinc finger transcription factor of the Zn(2)-Cys(6) binuclear cluster domain type [Scheffersomyces coipomensis]|uniref:zinc finger transcription factor of the Zn(2)-Cys(6) binuclear cluster domain type n=1 Tax=Scheffersomyces coipomensis TaxID=1788519 RepID=UPI00315D8E85